MAPAFDGDPVGVYRLTSLDKRSLPVTIYGVVGLADDGTYQLAVDILINADGDVLPVPLTGFGWYEVQGNQVAFTSDGWRGGARSLAAAVHRWFNRGYLVRGSSTRSTCLAPAVVGDDPAITGEPAGRTGLVPQ